LTPRPSSCNQARMIRAVLFLGSMILMGSASGSCEIESGDAVENAIESVLFIWAATKRCHGKLLQEAPVKCEQDVASAIQSVTLMGGAIAKIVDKCGTGLNEHAKCAGSVAKLVSSSAGLAAASGLIADKCFNTVPSKYDYDVLEKETELGKCVLDTGAGVNHIFAASNEIKKAKKHCEGKKCTTDVLNVVSIFSHLGGFIANSFDDCSTAHAEYTGKKGVDTKNAECIGAVLDGVGDLSSLAKLGLGIKNDCDVSSSRLYLDSNNVDAKATAGNPTLFALAAMIPVSAVLSFVAGSRFAKSRQQARAVDSHVELE